MRVDTRFVSDRRRTLPELSETALQRSGIRGEWISETVTRVRQGVIPYGVTVAAAIDAVDLAGTAFSP